ncbi:unnamed protein product [Pseudo-nitzschia multistriata]|uniref:Uncharacterized protein n=1 Tax=Pseudo-nitzschia multistriata TaxID=183589 RepID=A0A448Z0R5_9STRA|nr:unnamed protein product [Pseudo-nitzschia multistriata]
MPKEGKCVKKAATAKHKITASKSTKGLTSSQQKMIDTIAAISLQMQNNVVSRSIVAMQLKLTLKSVNNALSKLKQKGLVTMDTGVSVSITQDGVEQANLDSAKICKNNREHHLNTMDTFKLTPKQRQLFEELSDGSRKTKKNVASSLGYNRMKSFQNLLMPLKKFGILCYDKDTLWLSDAMFIFEARKESGP